MVSNPAAEDLILELSTHAVPLQRSVLSVAEPVGNVGTVDQVGVDPAPALVNTWPVVPAEPPTCNGLEVPAKFTPALVVTKPAAEDFTFEFSIHALPFQRKVLSVAEPVGKVAIVDQIGVAPAPALVKT